MAIHGLINNFTGGEISPQIDARTDLQKYGTSCQTMENMRPLPWGGAVFRTGTLMVAPTKYANYPSRLIPFKFDTNTTFAVEFGNYYLRFYANGVPVSYDLTNAPAWVNSSGYSVGSVVQYSGVIYTCIVTVSSVIPPVMNTIPSLDTSHWIVQAYYEITSPYAEQDVFGIQYVEINDVVYLTHPKYFVYKLARNGPLNWSIGSVYFKYPALLDENTDNVTTLAVSTLSPFGGTLTASAPIFNPLHVSSFWEIKHLRDSTSMVIAIGGGTNTSGTMSTKGDWTVTTTERWYGTLQVQRSTDGGTTWVIIRSFQASGDRNVNASGTQDTDALFRLVFISLGDPYGTSVWAGGAPTQYVYATAKFETADAYIAGLLQINGYTDSYNVHYGVVNGHIPQSTNPTAIWSEGAFSYYRGFPQAVGLYEQRLIFAGTAYKPTNVWGSVTGDFENFAYSDNDDAAFSYQVASAQQNPIRWLADLIRIHAGSAGNEIAIASGNTDEALTPSNITARSPSSHGSAAVQPVNIGGKILFLQRQGRRIRELGEVNPYATPGEFLAPDLTILAEHITTSGIVQMDFALLPDPQVYCVRADGVLAVLTYNREQNITAWARYTHPNGAFESVACVYGETADVVYVVVRRTIQGVTKRFVEVFTAELADKVQSVHSDCSTLFDDGGTHTVFSGLGYLEGQAVAVVADGNVVTGLTVSGGSITLPFAARVVRVGLGYIGTLTPMKLDLQMASGASQGRRRRITELCFRFKDTLGATYGNSTVSNAATGEFCYDIPFRKTSDPMDSSPPLFTGDKVVPWAGKNDLVASVTISQQQPLPMTVLSMVAKMEVFGD